MGCVLQVCDCMGCVCYRSGGPGGPPMPREQSKRLQQTQAQVDEVSGQFVGWPFLEVGGGGLWAGIIFEGLEF